MPFIDGETLRDKLDRETQLGVDEAVRIATDVADALDYAHRHGVIHRDIKPENILLHDGRPMVADFGIALAVSAAAGGRMTETGLSLGTPHYMSPEQATAEKEINGAQPTSTRSACVLYEMLAGEPPHTGASAQQIIMKIIAEPAAAGDEAAGSPCRRTSRRRSRRRSRSCRPIGSRARRRSPTRCAIRAFTLRTAAVVCWSTRADAERVASLRWCDHRDGRRRLRSYVHRARVARTSARGADGVGRPRFSLASPTSRKA